MEIESSATPARLVQSEYQASLLASVILVHSLAAEESPVHYSTPAVAKRTVYNLRTERRRGCATDSASSLAED
jgi:hypothetical protein